jgi:hypothetical protein
VRRATLILTRAGVSDRRVISSDDRGLFLFEDLPGGVYTLSASKGGFLPASYGAAKAGLPAAPIPVADGQRVALAPLALTSGSVITGRITDDVGLPVADAAVYAAQYEISNGVRRRRNLPAGPIRVTTNAHGDYRIFGVSAGDYLVGAVAANAPLGGTVVTAAELQWAQRQSQAAGSAGPQPAAPGAATPDVSPAAGRAFGDAMTYFPGTVDIGAAAIVSLGRAQERGGLDFRLQKLPLARVRGIVVGPDGQPVPSATLIRSPKAESIVPSSGGFAERGMADGTFVVRGGVPPGEHIVSVRSAARPASTTQAVLWGRAELNIHGEDVTDLTIQLQPTVALSGVLVFEGTSPVPSSLGGVRLRLTASPETPVPFGSFVGSVQPDRSFKIPSLEPAHYRMTITVPSLLSGATEWVVKSAVLGGRDILDAAIDVRPGEDLTGVVVTLSDRHTELSGTLTDSAVLPAGVCYRSRPLDSRLPLDQARSCRWQGRLSHHRIAGRRVLCRRADRARSIARVRAGVSRATRAGVAEDHAD